MEQRADSRQPWWGEFHGDQPTIDDLPHREVADDLMAQSNLAAWLSEAKRDAKTLSSDDMADVIVACMTRENWTLVKRVTP